MSGLSFSGKTTLAKQLAEPLKAELLPYDFDIYEVYKPALSKNISKAGEWVVVEAKARERIAALLKNGTSVIFDDLSVELSDRDMLRETARKCDANSLVVYMDISSELSIERQKQNEVSKERGLTSDRNMKLVISQLQPPDETEQAVKVSPSHSIEEVVAQIKKAFHDKTEAA